MMKHTSKPAIEKIWLEGDGWWIRFTNGSRRFFATAARVQAFLAA